MFTLTATYWEMASFLAAIIGLAAASGGIAMPLYDLIVARSQSVARYRTLARYGLVRAVAKLLIQGGCVTTTSFLILSPQVNPARPTSPGAIATSVLIMVVSAASCVLVVADFGERHQIIVKELFGPVDGRKSEKDDSTASEQAATTTPAATLAATEDTVTAIPVVIVGQEQSIPVEIKAPPMTEGE